MMRRPPLFSPRLRAVAGTVSTLFVLGTLLTAGLVAVLAAVAVAGAVAGGLFVWSKATARTGDRALLSR